VTSSSPPLGMSEEFPRRLCPRKVVNYNYILFQRLNSCLPKKPLVFISRLQRPGE
jgi:hypothetical protein